MRERKLLVEMTNQEFYDYLEYQKRGIAAVRMAEKLCKHLLEAIEVDDDAERDSWKYVIGDQDEMEEVQELAEGIRKILSTGEEA